MCDVEKVRKAYKIVTPAAAAAASMLNEERAGLEQLEERSRSADEKQRLERAILGAMALRGAT
jgi:histidinol-phosphate/aromatic aminotransferase/cobyric acid decarboxylase-like protein